MRTLTKVLVVGSVIYLGRWARNLTMLLTAEQAYVNNRHLHLPAAGDDLIGTPSRGLETERDW